MKVFEELRQRKVLQTAALYFAVAWGATEILSYLIERIPVFPEWANTAIAILFVLGFPVTVFLAWMFDVDEGGVRRADPASGIGKGVIVTSVAALLVVTGVLSYLLIPRIQAEKGFVREGDLSEQQEDRQEEESRARHGHPIVRVSPSRTSTVVAVMFIEIDTDRVDQRLYPQK